MISRIACLIIFAVSIILPGNAYTIVSNARFIPLTDEEIMLSAYVMAVSQKNYKEYESKAFYVITDRKSVV